MLAYSLRDGFLRHYLRGVVDGLKGLRTALGSRNVLTEDTMAAVRRIDSGRPGLPYMIRTRLLKRKVRL